MRTRVKICGITDEEGVLAACDAGADAVGFVFHPKSRRFIDPEEAFELVAYLPPFVSSIGLYVDATVERFSDIEEICPTDRVQLHGNESDDVVRRCGPGVIKAVRFDPDTIAKELSRWDGIDEVDAILIDGSAGGEGTSFDWTKLADHTHLTTKPIILAGGLTPQNVGEAIRTIRPYAVDVSSGVESEPGVKDRDLIEAFCKAVQSADATAE
ncbi:MAG: phosphoribosylanthranilate isomerase [Phycisphaerales bacterium]|nr:phosphoribosylanthranilate isomerase [Phycisphaerales bacterium]